MARHNLHEAVPVVHTLHEAVLLKKKRFFLVKFQMKVKISTHHIRHKELLAVHKARLLDRLEVARLLALAELAQMAR